MTRRTRTFRFLALGLTGGTLLQVAGCASGIAPVLLSLAESAFYTALVSRLFPL